MAISGTLCEQNLEFTIAGGVGTSSSYKKVYSWKYPTETMGPGVRSGLVQLADAPTWLQPFQLQESRFNNICGI